MKHASGLRLTLSGAAAAGVSAGQKVELQLKLVPATTSIPRDRSASG
jgi:hypothetical protein